MLETIHRTASGGLAYEMHGDGIPVVFLHGLTFDRTTWRPIIERLGDGVRSIAVDLPGHGDTAGEPVHHARGGRAGSTPHSRPLGSMSR